jgi:hypothetical protein
LGVSFLFNLIGRTYEFSPSARLLTLILAALVSSLIITYLAISTAPVLKEYLNTLRSLLRLDTLSHPLLLKLQQNAPSSFHHSLMVSNLAHRAAKAIGADALLVRIGGYYHDIGKSVNPSFFIENQPQQEKLRKIGDYKSKAKKIRSHVREGIKLARDYHLPQEIINLIAQSHGTNEISFLYVQARRQKLKIPKSELRYQGPKPQTKEAAILMLADGVESKIRAYKELTPKMVEKIVEEIIETRLDSRQFELSGLTRTDLLKIRKALIEGVNIIHHQRIHYPR